MTDARTMVVHRAYFRWTLAWIACVGIWGCNKGSSERKVAIKKPVNNIVQPTPSPPPTVRSAAPSGLDAGGLGSRGLASPPNPGTSTGTPTAGGLDPLNDPYTQQSTPRSSYDDITGRSSTSGGPSGTSYGGSSGRTTTLPDSQYSGRDLLGASGGGRDPFSGLDSDTGRYRPGDGSGIDSTYGRDGSFASGRDLLGQPTGQGSSIGVRQTTPRDRYGARTSRYSSAEIDRLVGNWSGDTNDFSGTGWRVAMVASKSASGQQAWTQGTPQGSTVTYSYDVRGIIERRGCLDCHSLGATTPASPILESYVTVRDAARSVLGQVNTDTMPPDGYQKLSQDEKDGLDTWVRAGTPE